MELREVNWPTRSQAINFTLLVIGFSILVAAVLGALDLLFAWLLELVI